MSKKKKKKTMQAKAPEPVKVQEKTEEPDLMGWHILLFWIKILLVTSYLFNIYAYVKDGIQGSEMIDLLVYVVLLVLLIVSIVFHKKKLGVYTLFAFGITELLYNIVVMILASQKGVYDTVVGNRAFEYLAFSALILIPTFIYYRKRMHLFKS